MKVFFFLALTLSLFAKTEIIFWHAFEGFLAEKFNEIVEDFNHQSSEYKVSLVYKGNYTEVFNRGVEAFKSKNAPHILQVYEVATQEMMLMPEIYIPVDELLAKYFRKFDPAVYIDAVRQFYSKDERMISFPWNASTGILFYNKEAFKKAGLDPERPPKTWIEVESFGRKLVAANYKGFTSAWPAAYHLEHFSSWHNLPFATEENGFAGLSAKLCFDGPYQIRHLKKLVEWQKEGIFSYQGRFTNEPEAFFKEGKCAILLQGANRYSVLKGSFPVGVGFMPYWPDIDGAPYRLNIGGSSFWAISGFDQELYRGIAQFFSYLSMAEIQAYWHQQTGYLPITESAYYLSKKKGFYRANPAAEIAVLEVMNQNNTPNTRGIRLKNYIQIREIIIDHLEKALEGKMDAGDALEQAIQKGNAILAYLNFSQSRCKV